MRFGAGRHGRVGRRLGGVVVALAVAALVLLAPLGRLLPSAPALAAPANASAAGYLPTASQLPGAWREEATLDVSGLLEPDSHLRRVFVSADGGQTVVVEVAVRPSAVEAQTSLDARVNQLVLYHGWLFGAIAGLGDRAYRGIGVTADGLTDQTLVFRVKALAAEVGLISSVENPALVDAIARIVESRMLQDPNAVLAVPGFPATPQTLPGKEPPGPPVGGGGVGSGDAGVGNTAGGVGTTDTMLQITLLNIDRPWPATNGFPPPTGFNYLTLDVLIEVQGPTTANILLEDFSTVALDGREWPAIVAREPAVRASQVVMGAPVRGWLTFAIPTDQQALQLIWRLRSTVPLATQGGGDDVLTIPLTVGASASAGLGTPAPPNSVSIDPNNPVPPGSAPLGPIPSYIAPSSSTSSSGTGGSSSGGGRAPRGGTGLR